MAILISAALLAGITGCSATPAKNNAYMDLAGKEANKAYQFANTGLGERQLYPLSTGTVYYVSATGDDKNDGLSPETPIKSLAKASMLPLKPGDSVLFKKGDDFLIDINK